MCRSPTRSEIEVLGNRIEWAKRYVAANPINQFVTNPADAWLGIVAGGYDMQQVLEALRVLGLDPERLGELGVRVLKLGALHPLDHGAIRELANGTATVMVCEDKLDFLESRVRSVLYGSANAPAIVGKVDHDGKPLITHYGALTIDNLVDSLRRVLTLRIPADQLATVRKSEPVRIALGVEAVRTPFFCSGCPHNTGLLVPEGSLVGAGIGCHGMVSIVPREQTGHVTGITQMGGEGAQWIGTAPFVEDHHFFQNMGDGTFFHSGQLAVQAAVASGTTMTFKILYNAAVAMTGGQDAAGLRSVPEMAQMLMAEGVKHITITTDDPREVPRRRSARRRRRRASRRHRRRAGEVARDRRRHRAHPRPAVRGGEASRPQARHPRAGHVPGDDRRARVRGMRRLRRAVELPVAALHRDRVRSQDGDRPGQLQRRCELPEGRLPGVHHRQAGQGEEGQARRASERRRCRSRSSSCPPTSPFACRASAAPASSRSAQVLAAAAQIAGVECQDRRPDGSVAEGRSCGVDGDASAIRRRARSACCWRSMRWRRRRRPTSPVSMRTPVSRVVSTSIAPTGRMIGKVASHGLDLAPFRAELGKRTDAAAQPVRRCVRRSSRRCWATPSPPTSSWSASPTRPGFIPLPGEAIERAIELNGTAVEANLAAFRWGRRWAVDPSRGREGRRRQHRLPARAVRRGRHRRRRDS